MEDSLIFGVNGAILILFGFIYIKFINRNPSSLMYNFINFLGSYFLSLYSILIDAPIFVVLNIIWMIASSVDILKYLFYDKRTKNCC